MWLVINKGTMPKALIFPKKRGNFKVGSRSISSPGTGQLLVKIRSAALNPVDYKIRDTGISVTHCPVISGVDIAGIVQELGEGVENFRKGNKVLAHGNFSIIDQGAFQRLEGVNYITGYIASQIPSNQSFDSAATVPLGEQSGSRDTPSLSEKPIVILGGSSSVGSYTIQLARLSGFYPVVTTASPNNEDLVMGYGATHFFDRHLSGNQLAAAISKVTDSPIRIVFDTISLPETQSEDEGKGRKAVSTIGSPHLPHNHELFRSSWAMVEKWLSKGIIQPNNHEILPNGLEGIIGGLERMRMGQVSGTKLVAHPQETQ
ncbi:chaperonin 10-like protein [Suillus placidus]|uniref:Chaperonin 10-like protein n=1 Tax=Suillus placidus TaxID=48579 RepID=A0A9P7D7C1_9AGAM|nr:chaperonin 10-like protein [Suillus placidus]